MIIIKKQYNIITDFLGVFESSSYNELDGEKGTINLEAVQHDTRMTFIPEQAHFISIYFFASVLMMRDDVLFLIKSFQKEFILVFIPNEILVLVRDFTLVSCKLKTNTFSAGG